MYVVHQVDELIDIIKTKLINFKVVIAIKDFPPK